MIGDKSFRLYNFGDHGQNLLQEKVIGRCGLHRKFQKHQPLNLPVYILRSDKLDDTEMMNGLQKQRTLRNKTPEVKMEQFWLNNIAEVLDSGK